MDTRVIFTNQVEEAIDSAVESMAPAGVYVLVDTNTAKYVLPRLQTGSKAIAAAKVLGSDAVWMTDIDESAVRCARENAVRNGVEGVHIVCGDALDAVEATGFDWILSNPPYHADFSVAKKFIEKGFNRLKVGGKLVMVVKRELWYRNKLTAIFGGVKMAEIDGYYIFTAEKRNAAYAPKKQKAPKTPPKENKKRRKP